MTVRFNHHSNIWYVVTDPKRIALLLSIAAGRTAFIHLGTAYRID
jgi:hypothetical protein